MVQIPRVKNGEGGIRTHESLAALPHFECGAFVQLEPPLLMSFALGKYLESPEMLWIVTSNNLKITLDLRLTVETNLMESHPRPKPVSFEHPLE